MYAAVDPPHFACRSTNKTEWMLLSLNLWTTKASPIVLRPLVLPRTPHPLPSAQFVWTCWRAEGVAVAQPCWAFCRFSMPRSGLVASCANPAQVVMPRGSDAGFVRTLHQTFAGGPGKKHPCYKRVNRMFSVKISDAVQIMRDPQCFIVEHYAGPVAYNTDGFVAKNSDRMHDSLRALVDCSENYFLRELFADVRQSVSQLCVLTLRRPPSPQEALTSCMV